MMKAAPLKSRFLGWSPLSLIVRAGHPLLSGSNTQRQRNYPLLSPGHFSIDRWPADLRRYLSGPLHVIEDYGVASRITELSDAIWLSSTFAAMFEIRSGRLPQTEPPQKQKAFRFKMMMYSLDRRSLSPAARMLETLFQKQLGALVRER
jgi:DNA-binding transcriptional LysR family regulator